MNIHGHCYVLPLAAVGAAPLPPPVLSSNTNMNQVNNSQISTAVNCGINPLSMSNNGTISAPSNSAGCAGIQGTNYPPLHHETSTKYLLGAQNLLPNLLQDQTQHPRQPHHSLIHLNPNHQINHALHLQQQQQQHLLSIPYQTNNLQTATLTPAFHPFFATPSLPRSTSNLSNLSHFSSQHHSPKNVQQLGQVAATVHHVAASGHQHIQHHNMQNCAQPSTSHSTPQHHHVHQQMQDHVMNRQQMQNVSSQSILQATEQPQLYNPFLTSASILSASNMIPKAPLLQTPALGKVRKSILYNFNTYELEYHLSFPLFLSFSLSFLPGKKYFQKAQRQNIL